MGVELRHVNGCLFLRRQLRLLKDLMADKSAFAKSTLELLNSLDSKLPNDENGIPPLEVFESYLIDDLDASTVLHHHSEELLRLEKMILEQSLSETSREQFQKNLRHPLELKERSKFFGRKAAFEILERGELVRPRPSEELTLKQTQWILYHRFQFVPSYQEQGFLTVRDLESHLLMENRGCPHIRWQRSAELLDLLCDLEADFFLGFLEVTAPRSHFQKRPSALAHCCVWELHSTAGLSTLSSQR